MQPVHRVDENSIEQFRAACQHCSTLSVLFSIVEAKLTRNQAEQYC